MSLFSAVDAIANQQLQAQQSTAPVQKTGPLGLQLIEYFEGLRLTPYRDTAGIWSVGYGHSINVDPKKSITFDEAVSLLAKDLATAEHTVFSKVAARLKQNEFDAIVSFVYNVGSGNFLKSNVYADLQRFKFDRIPYDLSLWNKSGGRITAGLVTRRHAEGVLFAQGTLDFAPIAVPDDHQA
jgi:lysozyme